MLRRPLAAGSLMSALLLTGCADDAPLPLQTDGAVPLAQAPAPAVLQAPVFGLATSPDGGLLVAETLRGVTELRKGSSELIAPLSGVAGIAPVGRGSVLAVTSVLGAPDVAQKVYRVSRGGVQEVADLARFEREVNPDAGYNPEPDSNPFGIAHLHGGTVLVADAAGNDVLVVDERGTVDWVALLTPRPNPAPMGPPQLQPVPTSVAVGPDGAYYVGELTGFPAVAGLSRVWRIRPGSRHVSCPSEACTLVADGFTSIMDLAFGPDGTLYVVEFDEAGWLAVEMAGGSRVQGGTVSACDVRSGACAVRAGGLDLPTSVTVDRDGRVWVAEHTALMGGTSSVHPLP